MQALTEWKTAGEVASHFKIKLPTVRLWTRQGMPHLQVGRLVRFDLASVESWLKQRQVKSNGAVEEQ